MKEGIPKRKSTLETQRQSVDVLRNNLAGQGAYFEKLAVDQGLPQELAKLPEGLRPKRIETSKGSVYSYLPDGRTQRFKKASSEQLEPQDVLVFVPPWKYIAEKTLATYPDTMSGIENETIFIETLLEYAQRGEKTIRLIDEAGREVLDNKGAQEAQQIFMALIDKKDESKPIYIPVGKRPALGWLTFDTRKYTEPDGSTMREKHLGNTVVKIEF